MHIVCIQRNFDAKTSRKAAYWVNETSFWKPDDNRREHIVRSGRIQDTEDGLSEFPHVILNQARVHDFFLDVMRHSPAALEPTYSCRLLDLTIDSSISSDDGSADKRSSPPDYPVTAKLERLHPPHEGQTETVRARFVVGCEGARGTLRNCIERSLHGDSANQAWGVMDVLAVTDFPKRMVAGASSHLPPRKTRRRLPLASEPFASSSPSPRNLLSRNIPRPGRTSTP